MSWAPKRRGNTASPQAAPILYISKTDEENSDYNSAFETLRDRFGKNVAPGSPHLDENKKVIGIIDVLNKRAYTSRRKRHEIPIPENKKDVWRSSNTALVES
jgi:elongation factor G